MKLRAVSHPFNCFYLATFSVQTEHQTGENCPPIYQHRAGAALAELASMFSSRQRQIFPQDFEQSLVGRKRDLGRFAIQREFDMRLLFCSLLHRSIPEAG